MRNNHPLTDFMNEIDSNTGRSADSRLAQFAADEVWLVGLKEFKQRQQAREPENAGSSAQETLAAAMLRIALPGPLGLAGDMARTAHEDTFGRTREQG
jgi:hypothetical protein